jgi:hypothetical protein
MSRWVADKKLQNMSVWNTFEWAAYDSKDSAVRVERGDVVGDFNSYLVHWLDEGLD